MPVGCRTAPAGSSLSPCVAPASLVSAAAAAGSLPLSGWRGCLVYLTRLGVIVLLFLLLVRLAVAPGLVSWVRILPPVLHVLPEALRT
jgi:hypothetical protein